MSEFDTANFKSLYKGRLNLINMLEQQNYNVDEYTGFKTNELYFMIKNSQLDMLLENKNNKKIYVKFFEMCEKKPKLLNKTAVDNMIEDLFLLEKILNKNDTLMIISNNDLNDTMKLHIRHIWEDMSFNIVIVNIKNLQFNLLNHKYVPKHVILSDEEKNTFMNTYNIKNDNNIPEISRFDPVSQILCMKPSEVCKILRPSKNAIEAPYWRICKNK